MAEENVNVQDEIRQEQERMRIARAQQYYSDLRARGNAIDSMVGVHPAVTAQMAGQQHFGQMNGMMNQLNSAISGEMQSRVNQEREARRLEHEKELMRMKTQSDIYGAAIRSLLS